MATNSVVTQVEMMAAMMAYVMDIPMVDSKVSSSVKK